VAAKPGATQKSAHRIAAVSIFMVKVSLLKLGRHCFQAIRTAPGMFRLPGKRPDCTLHPEWKYVNLGKVSDRDRNALCPNGAKIGRRKIAWIFRHMAGAGVELGQSTGVSGRWLLRRERG
jgi:hypothetical protein